MKGLIFLLRLASRAQLRFAARHEASGKWQLCEIRVSHPEMTGRAIKSLCKPNSCMLICRVGPYCLDFQPDSGYSSSREC